MLDDERLTALGWERVSTGGTTCKFVRPGWPSVAKSVGGEWQTDRGYTNIDPVEALLSHIAVELDEWTDSFEFARKQIARLEYVESELKDALLQNRA